MTDREDARARILDRIRAANSGREPEPHPGTFPGAAGGAPPASWVRRFIGAVEAAGGEVIELADEATAGRWLERFAGGFGTAVVSPEVGDAFDPGLPVAPTHEADLGVSRAIGGAVDTGTVVLSSREGRGLQLLPPTHLVLLDARDLHETLTAALEAARDETAKSSASSLPSAVALHSGPSKSADIGGIVVKGVHGPGRLVVALVGAPRRPSPEGPAGRGDPSRSVSSEPGDACTTANETEPGTGP